MMFALCVVASVPLVVSHGAMSVPPSFLDPNGTWAYGGGGFGAGCLGDKNVSNISAEGCAVEWYSNYTFIPGEYTIPPKSPLLTYLDACQNGTGVESCCSDFCQDAANQLPGQPCEGCDWTRKNPWRAPGSAPVFSPCGFDGGNPEGCPIGHPGTDGCNGGGYGHGPDGRSFVGNTEPAYWQAGATAEVSWGTAANHGGGYSYRLCPKPTNNTDLTEECFQQTPLRFVGDTQWLQYTWDVTTRQEIPAVQTDVGTVPLGSQWRRVPIPACIGTGGGSSPQQANCTVEGGGTGETQFPPPLPGIATFHNYPWNMIDHVHVPNTVGDFVISFRYDCEQTSQVWQQCGDVRIIEGSPPKPHACPGGSIGACKWFCPEVGPSDPDDSCLQFCQERCDDPEAII